MVITGLTLTNPANHTLWFNDVYLRYPRLEDYDAWAALRDASRQELQPFEPSWIPDELSKPNFRRRLRVYARDIRAGTVKPYFVFQRSDDQLVGGCVLSNIRYRVAMTGTIGYWTGTRFTRRGYALSAVLAVVSHAFEVMGLERLEAACLHENSASQNLLQKAGFKREGVAESYLKINGTRRDHVLFGLSRQKFSPEH